MSSRRYRSRLQIMVDIIETIKKEGGKSGVTRILYGANLSYDRLMKYLKELVEAGLIKEIREKDKTIYVFTVKGNKFIKEYRKIKEFAQAFGIII
ncbi:MAG TPA: hypothetical protein EYP16_03770 [Candidatus Atribacteria bacterium]|nr:hypothetical protein [Candidatus Atribacteria bacterium]